MMPRAKSRYVHTWEDVEMCVYMDKSSVNLCPSAHKKYVCFVMFEGGVEYLSLIALNEYLC